MIEGKQTQGIVNKLLQRKGNYHFFYCLKSFQKKIEQWIYYICGLCNRTFHEKSVRIFESNENDLTKFLATNVLSHGNKKYICMTCNKKTEKKKILCQVDYNKPESFDVHQELKSLNKLEIALIPQWLLFKKKIAITVKGQIPKVKAAIFNIAVDVRDVSNSLKWNTQSSGNIQINMENLPTWLWDRDEDEKIRIKLANESDIEDKG